MLPVAVEVNLARQMVSVIAPETLTTSLVTPVIAAKVTRVEADGKLVVSSLSMAPNALKQACT